MSSKKVKGLFDSVEKEEKKKGVILKQEREQHHLDRKLQQVADEKGQLASKYKESLKELTRVEGLLEFKEALHDQEVKPLIIRPTEKKEISESTAVTIFSDVHVEERVLPESVNGLNEYTPAICKVRSEKYFRTVVSLTNILRHGTKIENLVLHLGGDNISGYIHEELEETNYLSPIKATAYIRDIIVGGIDYLIKAGGFKQILIPCSVGNHGRLTKKTRHSSRVENNLEWYLYQELQHIFEDERKEKIVKFILPKGYHTLITIYDWINRFHHGDAIKYYGAIGGIATSLNKKLMNWNQGSTADIDWFGHHHQEGYSRVHVSNGSVIGTTNYSLDNGFPFTDPTQVYALISKHYGKNLHWSINLK